MKEKTQKVIKKSLTVEECLHQHQYQSLKKLLLSEEKKRLEQLEFYFQNPIAHAEKIALALPHAIQQTDEVLLAEALGKTLEETVQNCLIESVHQQPALYVEALYPVILPMIKKSIAEAFKDVMQSLNSAIEEGLSLNRFSWHYQAWRGGIPYREVVLRNTLAYRVEQAFLIHRETGLLLHHVSIVGLDKLRDSDAISAMLTAIQDFTHDSFSMNTHDQLDTVEVGDYTVFLNRGAYAMLACVIQGIPPYALREQFETILSDIHQQHITLLTQFSGDNEPLAIVDKHLQKCLLSERKQSNDQSSVSGKYILIPLGLLFILFSYWGYDHWKFEQRRADYLSSLQNYQGIIITENHYEHGQLRLKGLYDPLMPHPDAILEQSSLAIDEVMTDWQPYHSLDSEIVEQRLRLTLQAPASVKIHLHNTVLKLTGIAEEQWIKQLATVSTVLTGITHLDHQQLQTHAEFIRQYVQAPQTVHIIFKAGQLTLEGIAPIAWRKTLADKLSQLDFIIATDLDKLEITEVQNLKKLQVTLEKQRVYFTDGAKINALQAQNLLTIATIIQAMQQLMPALQQTMTLVVTGYTDGLYHSEYNQTLSLSRAKKIINLLEQHLTSVKMAAASQLSSTKQADKLKRKVSFTVIFNRKSQIK